MFSKLLHGLTATVNRIVQLWTKDNIPAGVQTRHDFKDGTGLVPAAPMDACGIENTVLQAVHIDIHRDGCGIRNEAISIVEIPKSTDSCGIRNSVVNVIEFPKSVDACGVRSDIIAFEAV